MANQSFGFNTTSEEVTFSHSSQIANKTILITGISPGGLGLQTALALAPHSPALLILAARSPTALAAAKTEIAAVAPDVPIKHLTLDLSSFRTVRAAATELNGWSDVSGIDILVNNAGVMSTPWALSEDGVESQFATNHLGPWLFTNLIMEKIIQAKGRVVIVSSVGHMYGDVRFEDWNFENGKLYDPDVAYGQSKTANALNALSIVSKLGPKGVTAFSVHPGLVMTNITRAIPIETLQIKGFLDEEGKFTGIIPEKTISQGAATALAAALDPEIVDKNGAYLADCKVEHDNPVAEYAKSLENAERLWQLSERLTGEKFDF
ncbi:WW domain-containing oxidoreductase [Dendryphion nanum]|uniref:WW domain-containing oxidoreductase n=1 Tax=Dendryphion nanum TaxID=256645 RepID=A0A9P9IYX9_9PLEO|nr:WW domain-containing oxidoreductase [Dendryphion nanum]